MPAPLPPSVQALAGTPRGQDAIACLEASGARVTFVPGGGFNPQTNSINVDPSLLGGDPKAIAGMPVHEARHAFIYDQDVRPRLHGDKETFMTAAMRNEAVAQGNLILHHVQEGLAVNASMPGTSEFLAGGRGAGAGEESWPSTSCSRCRPWTC